MSTLSSLMRSWASLSVAIETGWGTLCADTSYDPNNLFLLVRALNIHQIALPRKGSLSKQGDRHLASLCNDHTAYLCDNQKLNRNREQESASTFRWLSAGVWALWALHLLCVFSLCVHSDNLGADMIFIWKVQRQRFLFMKVLRDTSMGAINSLYSISDMLLFRGETVKLSNVAHQIHK